MKCYAAKAIYHVKATVCLLALGPANPIIKYTERQCKNSTTVNAPPESPVPHRQTESWLLHQTQAAFITAIYADAALSPLMDELKERYGSGGLGLDTRIMDFHVRDSHIWREAMDRYYWRDT